MAYEKYQAIVKAIETAGRSQRGDAVVTLVIGALSKGLGAIIKETATKTTR